jgi:hypothetical protein
MKKLLVLAAMMMAAMSGFAQDDKSYVCVAVFENATGTSSYKSVTNTLRNEIMEGIMATTRIEVLDITTQNLPSNKNALLEALKEKGINYLLEGKLNAITTGYTTDGKSRKAEVNSTLTLTDVETKLTKSTVTYNESGIGKTTDAAILDAVSDTRKNMEKFVDDNFKVAATIKTLDQVDEKKGVVKSCYISTGGDAGVQRGQIFEVFAEVEVAGERVSKKIGELKAKEVLSGTLTLCDVKNGGDVIKTNFDQGIQMTVLTRAKKDTFGLRKMFK